MAKSVRYFEDFESEEHKQQIFSEGPFVIVNANGWRIEVEGGPEAKCPVLPDPSIYRLRKELGYPMGKFNKCEDAEKLCDHLNMLAKEGRIVRIRDYCWCVPGKE